MARSNPVRYQYMLVGTDVILAGIRPDTNGEVSIVREIGSVTIDVPDPADRLWITKRAVTSAAARAKVDVNLDAVPYAVIEKELKNDPQAGFRSTINHIIHMFPRDQREDPEVIAFAEAQIAALEQTYEVQVAA